MDAYRGLVMFALASSGLGIHAAAQNFPESPVWSALGFHTEHVPWVGCSAWDMIQPSFMFLVGAAMAFSYARRRARGDSYSSMFLHALIRSVVLVGLGVLLASNWDDHTVWEFPNVLAQIGLGYTFLFLLWNRPAIAQLAAALVILIAYWGWFALYPLPPQGFDYASVGVPDDWQHLEGFAAHWQKNTNPAAAFDRWLLNLFPRKEPFAFNKGGYTTLNFVPSLATMIFGLMVGELLRSDRRGGIKLTLLVAAGLAGVLAGWALDRYGICPVVKRIWTPSWALDSSGWACLVLAVFYGAMDLWSRSGLARAAAWLTFPLNVFGANSILVYMMGQLARSWTKNTLEIHLGNDYSQVLGAAYAPIVEAGCVTLVFWLFCYWLYRQKIFVRI
ncbi:MAG: acyltransferase family protein [Thermoguttaceae bacterium]